MHWLHCVCSIIRYKPSRQAGSGISPESKYSAWRVQSPVPPPFFNGTDKLMLKRTDVNADFQKAHLVMASDESYTSGDHSIVSDTLECKVCMEKYGKNREPKVLPCGHTYCHICLDQCCRGTMIHCPKCRREHPVPFGGVEKLPKNFVIQDLLDHRNTKRQVSKLRTKESQESSPHQRKEAAKGSLSKETQQLLSTLRVSVKDVDQSGTLLGDTINKIQSERAVLSDTYKTTKSSIKKVLGDIVKAANHRKDELLNELEESFKECKALLTAQEEEYKEEKASHEEYCKGLRKSLKDFEKAEEAHVGELEMCIQEAQAKARSFHHGKEVASDRLVFSDDHCGDILSNIKTWGNLKKEHCPIKVPHPSCQASGSNPSVSDTAGESLSQYAMKDKSVRTYGNQPGTQLNSPSCVTELPNGDVAVGSAMSYTISIFSSPQDKRSISLGIPPGEKFNDGVTGMCMSPTGRLYVSNPDMNTVHVLALDGKSHYQLQAHTTRDEEFSPRGMACTASGELYVCDWANHTVRVFDQSVEIRRFGARGKEPGQFNRPSDIALMPDGDVAVADFNNHRIQVCDGKTGNFLWLFGTEGCGIGQLKGPTGVAVDSEGYIAVSERLNNRVQLFNKKGKPFKILGGQGEGSDQLKTPMGVTISRDNQILVCDSRNDRVLVF
ncbi:RING finger protein nhl-1-like [Patiria miniata]|uniref:RING-type domain-containing protein n=1 Tax=Patiria miniata TaxID=46514 RepID=A0A913YZU5_PATMI|nr:RING finger protein nhl-1-like [Patiria miniata]